MNLDAFFSERDEDLLGASEPDPMGLLPVWTGFAGNLFKNRVNSRVSDLRAYTINLFHCWVVWRVRQNLGAVAWDAHPDLSRIGGAHKPAFSRSLFVLLEKIMLVGFYPLESVDGEGILGLARARRKGIEDINMRLHDTEYTVLVRQAQLGISGAYRSVFSTWLGILDPATGHPRQDPTLWAPMEVLFSDEYKNLSDALTERICEFLHLPKKPITLENLGEIPVQYRACFGSRESLKKRFASYWRSALQIEKGELALLGMVSQEHPDSSAMELFQKAKARPEGVGAHAIGIICEIAPILTRVEECFVILRSPQIDSYDRAAAQLEEVFGPRPFSAVLPVGSRHLEVLGHLPRQGIARRRLAKLFEIASLPARELVAQILAYHKEMVCDLRRAEPWLETVNDSWRCHVASDGKVQADGTHPWAHDFYGNAFLRLARDLREGNGS